MKRARERKAAGGDWPRLIGIGLLGLGGSFAAQAHESFMDCFDNRDDTVTCEAGYVDGSPPNAGDRILVKDDKGKTLKEATFDAEGSYTFERPGEKFMMVFVGTEIGHTLRVNSADLMTR